MDYSIHSHISLKSYDEIYNLTIRPKIEAIDIFLKSNTTPYSIDAVADLLEVTALEISNKMKELNLTTLDRLGLFSIIFSLQTELCALIKRQWEYQHESRYTAQMVAYIYNLNIHKVTSAFEDLATHYVENHNLSEVFKRIHSSIFHL